MGPVRTWSGVSAGEVVGEVAEVGEVVGEVAKVFGEIVEVVGEVAEVGEVVEEVAEVVGEIAEVVGEVADAGVVTSSSPPWKRVILDSSNPKNGERSATLKLVLTP